VKISEKSEQLLRAIRLTVKDEEFTAGELIALTAGLRAKECPELNAAIKVAKFNAKRLGHWLKKHQGVVVDDWRLCADRGRRPKIWIYFFTSIAELGEMGMLAEDATECELRMDVARKPGSLRQMKEISRQFDRIEDAEQRGLIAPRPKPELLTITRVDRTTGSVVTEILRDRNGEPLRDKSVATPAPKAEQPPLPVVQRPARMPKVNEGGRWREMTMEEYAASRNNTVEVSRPTFPSNGVGAITPIYQRV
jgi:hypothetical protein